MYPMIKTDCFVLRRNDFRDYDRLYTIYSREMGKISILARSCKKPKSKLSARLETFGEVRINFIKGKIFNHLAGIETKSHNKEIILNYEKLNFAGEVFSFFDRVIKMEERDEGVYDLLNDTLSAINDIASVFASPKGAWQSREELGDINDGIALSQASRNGYAKIKIYFFWRLIDILGYRPQLDSCSICGKIYQGATNFSPPFQGDPPAGGRGGSGSPPFQGGVRGGSEGSKGIFFNITEHILICRQCAGSGVLIKEHALHNLKQIFNLNLREFLAVEIDNQLISITDRAKEIKLSEL